MTRIGLILIALTPLAQGQTQDWESVSRTVRATLHEQAGHRGVLALDRVVECWVATLV